jgi:hypothetical protein
MTKVPNKTYFKLYVICSSGAYRFSDVMASAHQDTMKIIQEIQTKIQPDEGCCIQFSSVRFVPCSDTNFILSVKFHVALLTSALFGVGWSV